MVDVMVCWDMAIKGTHHNQINPNTRMGPFILQVNSLDEMIEVNREGLIHANDSQYSLKRFRIICHPVR